MFKTKAKKQQEQLQKDVDAFWDAYADETLRIDPFTGEEFIIHPYDLAYEITIGKDLDASPRNWARYDRLVAHIGDVYYG